jgi:transcriptional regulator with XRE-family HTH domain
MLATRSGVAASTIHKVESERMVPTNSVFLKITKGLGEGSDELMRDLDNRQRRWEQTSFVKKHPL